MSAEVGADTIPSVGAFTRAIRSTLQQDFGRVRVQGELSDVRRPRSGHVYLTLKDSEAVLPCVIWRSTVARLRTPPQEGQAVVVHGSLDVYPPHGRYQLQIRRIEPLGAGALQQAFEQLRARLAAEGLFEADRKQPLPALPRRIVLITSKTGAAVRDMVTVIRRRFPPAALLLLPVRVQGPEAAAEIARALAQADAHADADLILVGRGGGSLEDLWAFNEEVVARAIAACRTPVISAVGHETDVTIADLVADVRAATPSQAGELAVPEHALLLDAVADARARLTATLRRRLERLWDRVDALASRPVLRRPASLLQGPRHRLAALAQRVHHAHPRADLQRRRDRLTLWASRLEAPLPARLARAAHAVDRLAPRLHAAAVARVGRADHRLEVVRERLRALSPLAVLGRGYSLTEVVSSAARVLARRVDDVAIGDELSTRLSDGGHVRSRVASVERPPSGTEASA